MPGAPTHAHAVACDKLRYQYLSGGCPAYSTSPDWNAPFCQAIRARERLQRCPSPSGVPPQAPINGLRGLADGVASGSSTPWVVGSSLIAAGLVGWAIYDVVHGKKKRKGLSGPRSRRRRRR